MDSYHAWSFMIGFLCLESSSSVTSSLLYISVVYCLFLNCVFWYECIIIALTTYMLKDTWMIFLLGHLWRCDEFLGRCFCRTSGFIHLEPKSGSMPLGQMVSEKVPSSSRVWLSHSSFPPALYERSGLCFLNDIGAESIFYFDLSDSYTVELTVVLISISTMFNDVEHVWCVICYLCLP